jgi:hypothetical protein
MLMYAICLAGLWSQLHTSIIYSQFQMQLKAYVSRDHAYICVTTVLCKYGVNYSSELGC